MTDEEQRNELTAMREDLKKVIEQLNSQLAQLRKQDNDLAEQIARIVERQVGLPRGCFLRVTSNFLALMRQRRSDENLWGEVIILKELYEYSDGIYEGSVLSLTTSYGVGSVPLDILLAMRAAYLAQEENKP